MLDKPDSMLENQIIATTFIDQFMDKNPRFIYNYSIREKDQNHGDRLRIGINYLDQGF